MRTHLPIALLCLLASTPAALAQASATSIMESSALQRQIRHKTAETTPTPLPQQHPQQSASDLLHKEVVTTGKELQKVEPFKRWTLIPTFSWSFFNQGRPSWQEEDIQLFYRVNKQLLLGAEIDLMQRPPSGSDELYSALASWYPVKYLELHGKVSFGPASSFAPSQIYQAGLEYQVMPRLALLFDFQQLNFSSGSPVEFSDSENTSITQVKPGVSFWLTDKSWITFRYAHGWAYGTENYNYYSGTFNIGDIPGGGRLTMGFAYGTDPDLDFASLRSSLSNAYIGTLFYSHPLTSDVSIFGGVQYVYRLREKDNSELYQQLTPTLGLVWKF